MCSKNEANTFTVFTVLPNTVSRFVIRKNYASVVSASSAFFFLVVRLRFGFSSAAATV